MHINNKAKIGLAITLSVIIPILTLPFVSTNQLNNVNQAVISNNSLESNVTTSSTIPLDSNSSQTFYPIATASLATWATFNTVHKDSVIINSKTLGSGIIAPVSITDIAKANGPYQFVFYNNKNGSLDYNYNLTKDSNIFQIRANQYLLDYFVNGDYFYVIVIENDAQTINFNCFNLDTGVYDNSRSFQNKFDEPISSASPDSGEIARSKTLFATGGATYEDPNTYLIATGVVHSSSNIEQEKLYAFDLSTSKLLATSVFFNAPYTLDKNTSVEIPIGLVEYNGEIIIYSYAWTWFNMSSITLSFDPNKKGSDMFALTGTWQGDTDNMAWAPPINQTIWWTFLNGGGISSGQLRTFMIPINKTEFYSFFYLVNPADQREHRTGKQTIPPSNWLSVAKLDTNHKDRWNGDYNNKEDPGLFYKWISLNTLVGSAKGFGGTDHTYSSIGYSDDALYVEEIAGQVANKDPTKAKQDVYRIYEIPPTSSDKNITTIDDIFGTQAQLASRDKTRINDSNKNYMYTSTIGMVDENGSPIIANPRMLVTDTGGAVVYDLNKICAPTINEYQVGKSNKTYKDPIDQKSSNLVSTLYNYQPGNKIPSFNDILDGAIFNNVINENKFNNKYSRNVSTDDIEKVFNSEISEVNKAYIGNANIEIDNLNVKSKDFFTGTLDYSYSVTGADAWTNTGAYEDYSVSQDVFLFDWEVAGSIIGAGIFLILLLASLGGYYYNKKKKAKRPFRSHRGGVQIQKYKSKPHTNSRSSNSRNRSSTNKSSSRRR